MNKYSEILNQILLDDNVSALTLDNSDILGIDL